VDLNIDHPALQQELTAARTIEALEAAFVKVERLMLAYREPENFGRKLFTRGLDDLIPYLARALRFEGAPQTKSNANVCILATQFHATGGHTRVARDFAAGLGPNEKPLLILTNTWNGEVKYRGLLQTASVGKMQSVLGERAFLLLSAETLVEKTLELYMMLKATRPTRIVLMCHPFDIVAIVATWPFRDVVEFVHHCDHILALGASLPYSAHVDVTYTCYCACRANGVDAVYAGMTSATVGSPLRTRDTSRLRMSTCGDQHKYGGSARYHWTDYAVAALRQPGVEMLHIGEMSQACQAEVHQALSAAGLDPERYVFAGPKPSLPQALADNDIDIYLSSYPAPGGKANLEAMVAGVPVIMPVDDGVPPLLRFRLPLKHYVEVGAPEDLATAVPKALALGETMRSPDAAHDRDRETGRFDDFVAGRPLAPTPVEDVLKG
jgi:hypothetical protein